MKVVKCSELRESFFDSQELEESELVKRIIADVRQDGDSAVRNYTKQFDNVDLPDIKVSEKEIAHALNTLDPGVSTAIHTAAANIKAFSEKQMRQLKSFEIENKGVRLGQSITPINFVGGYIPGGNYPLLSTALMIGIPAKVAGVKKLVVCSPPSHDGDVHPLTLAAAKIAGIDTIYRVGGAQAIAAMAYGTESIEPVSLIVGPGNKYVNLAKKEVYGRVGIDFIAGPSEIIIIADEKANFKYIAADLLAQAEHASDAKPILITTSEKLIQKVQDELEKQLQGPKTAEIARKSLDNGNIILVNNISEAAYVANRYAPEHLELMLEDVDELKPRFTEYGSMFLGETPTALGDYASGTNHVLPTNRCARYTGGLSVFNFVKIATNQEAITGELYGIVQQLATLEGLEAHANAARIRK